MCYTLSCPCPIPLTMALLTHYNKERKIKKKVKNSYCPQLCYMTSFNIKYTNLKIHMKFLLPAVYIKFIILTNNTVSTQLFNTCDIHAKFQEVSLSPKHIFNPLPLPWQWVLDHSQEESGRGVVLTTNPYLPLRFKEYSHTSTPSPAPSWQFTGYAFTSLPATCRTGD